jgi:cob(I)alamin adenosyltransferase
MATNPGEWYEEQRQKAERLEAELAGARAVLEAAREVVRRLERQLELARYVGD